MTANLPGRGPIDTVICDIDGVVVIGKTPVPGAGDALRRMRDAGLLVLFVTNNSTKTPATIGDRLREIVGFDTPPETIVNSGAATAAFIADDVGKVYVLGTDGLRETLRSGGVAVTRDWREAAAVVAGLDFDVSYRAFTEAALAVQHGAVFFATNTDATYPTEEGEYPGAGALVAVIERAAGVDPVVCGKPHTPMRRMLEGLVGASPLVVGDRPETDLALGKAEGWATALVLTGVTSDADAAPEEYQPDVVVESIADLPGLLGI